MNQKKRANPRNLALSILNRLSHNFAFSDKILKAYFDKNPGLMERDKAFILNIVQGVIRWKLRLDWIIGQFLRFPFESIDPHVLNIMRMAVYQIFFMDRVPEFAIVNEAVNQSRKKGRHIASTVNAILRNICRNKHKIRFPDRKRDYIRFLSVFYSYPEWLIKKWLRELGEEETERLLDSQNSPPHITIRINMLKTDRDSLLTRLQREGIEATKTRYSPVGITIKRLQRSIDNMPLYRDGFFFVQDEASQLCSYILNPAPNNMILDMCAGLGVKSIHIAELIEKKGKIIALDINPKRLLMLADTSLRYQLRDTIYPVAGDALYASSIFNCSFDRILIDAPCSGLGTISRHPDIKWTRKEEDIKMLSEIQKKMLDRVAPLLKKGGRMLYVTCTISKEENEMTVRSFLNRHPEIRLLNIGSEIPWLNDLVDKEGFFRTYPHIHGMDGFFCALFSR